jgi:ABC-type iron transport system FetAB ATPase subunit
MDGSIFAGPGEIARMTLSGAACLRMREASFERSGVTIVPPANVTLLAGERAARVCADAHHAEVLAMMAAALVCPTGGTVLVGEYDPRVQPVHCKRLVGYVPHDPLPLSRSAAAGFIDYRAALWNIDVHHARARAALLLERLGAMHESFAYPIVAALLPFPAVLVLDRPQPAYAREIAAAAGPCAVFSTHLDESAAACFADRASVPA